MLHKNSISLQAAKKAREQEEKQEGRPKKNVYRIYKREMVGNLSFPINTSNCVHMMFYDRCMAVGVG